MNATTLNGTITEIPFNGIVVKLSYTMLVTVGNIVLTLMFLCYQYGCINFYEFITFFTSKKLQPFKTKLAANRILITKDKSVHFGEVEPNLLLKTGKYIDFLEQNREEWARRTGAKAYLRKLGLEFIPLGFTFRIRRRMKVMHSYGMETKLIYWNEYNLFYQSKIMCQGIVCSIGYTQVAVMDSGREERTKTSGLISHLKLPTFEIECPADLKDWVKHLVASTEALHKEEKEEAELLKEKPDPLDKLSPWLVPGDANETKLGLSLVPEDASESKKDREVKKKKKNEKIGDNKESTSKLKSDNSSRKNNEITEENNHTGAKRRTNLKTIKETETSEQPGTTLCPPLPK